MASGSSRDDDNDVDALMKRLEALDERTDMRKDPPKRDDLEARYRKLCGRGSRLVENEKKLTNQEAVDRLLQMAEDEVNIERHVITKMDDETKKLKAQRFDVDSQVKALLAEASADANKERLTSEVDKRRGDKMVNNDRGARMGLSTDSSIDELLKNAMETLTSDPS
mmetsp:Transcript_7001/g.9712  ORF Transcript_7001/g.9712 Transcript_7001/m.9712 type:complete len:167 (-) Transcript_7001:413-913(-)